MGELNKEQVEYLTQFIDVLNVAKIDTALIGEWGCAGMNEGSSFAVVGESPEFPGELAITRVPQLKARLDLVKNHFGFTIQYAENDGEIRTMKLVSASNSADFRCGHAASVRVPKRVSGADPVIRFQMSEDYVSDIQNAVSAFNNKKGLIKFIVTPSGIAAQIMDDNGDEFTSVVADIDTEFDLSYVYSAEVITRLLKLCVEEEVVTVGMSKSGILSMSYGDFTFFIQRGKER